MSNNIERAATARMPQQAAAQPGQATMIEQSRAQAEVHAAILVAHERPRNINKAEAEMRQVCSRKAMADRAFFSLPRAGENVTGPTIDLAKELARIWGNIHQGITELSRDDERGVSEMQAWAWDLESNARWSSTFIVPHARDTRSKGRQRLTQLQDVYENNANQGARRVRECIYKVLPKWFTDEAADICQDTLERGDGQSIQDRAAAAVQGFAAMSPPVTVDQLERHRGRPQPKWDGNDLAQLQILYRSLRRGEITRDEAFPTQAVTADEISHAAADPAPVQQAATGDTPLRADDPDLTAHLNGDGA